ncbi:MAG TPA: proton-conducting transporter membrane subunit [Acidobacteriota bacterium]|nr:proton-conducting transporter membrane subunit [Acidobacteriota bacterium]
MDPITFLFAGFLLLVAGAAVAAVVHRHRLICSWLSFFFVLPAAGCFLYLAILVFTGGPVRMEEPLLVLPGIGAALTVAVGPLSALLLLLISIISACTTLFSIKHTLRYQNESLLRYYPFLLIFFASMVGVVAVRDMFFFIVFWEIMTLTSYALVVFERGNPVNLRAGFVYFLATHITTACLIIAAIILYTGTPAPHSFGFDALSASLGSIMAADPAMVHLILALFFIGFVAKSGVLPLGFWLPAAYSLAPSGASAAFAGIMTKMGVYGVLIVFCELLPVSHYSYVWGQVIAVFGVISLFVGSISALTQDDSNRIFSFSVIGQIGYIFLGIGLGIFLLPISPPLAVIALVSGVFHLLNDSIYKCCLFLNAGAIIYRTGTSDLNKVGGLLRIMPFTGAAAIIAALSISGAPPFSGFSSKLLLFQASIISGTGAPSFIVYGLVALFISAVTLAYMLKFIGSAFLGKLHSPGGINAHKDVPLSMKIPQGILAFLCIFLGLIPLLPLRMIHSGISSILPADYAPPADAIFGASLPGFSLDAGQGVFGVWNPIWALIAIAVLFALGYFLSKAGMARTREAETWYGGREHVAEHVRYASQSFYNPFKRLFAFTLGGIRFEGVYPRSISLPKLTVPGVIKNLLDLDRWLYYPFAGGFLSLSRWFSKVHVGIPQVYVLWMILGVIACIVILFMLPAK